MLASKRTFVGTPLYWNSSQHVCVHQNETAVQATAIGLGTATEGSGGLTGDGGRLLKNIPLHWNSRSLLFDFKRMDSIPEPIRSKLALVGSISIDELPSDKNADLWKEVQTRCDLLPSELSQLMTIRFPQDSAGKGANRFVFFKVSARVISSKSLRAWRAKVFVMADDCNGFYFQDEQNTIYYENDDLLLAVLFKSEDEARRFRFTLEKKAMGFGIIRSLSVSTTYEDVVLPAKPREISPTHYRHGDSDSPHHSLAPTDYGSQSDDETSVVSIGGKLGSNKRHFNSFGTGPCRLRSHAIDAYHTLQMIEDPDHPLLYLSDLYRWPCESRASNSSKSYNCNNVLILSDQTYLSADVWDPVRNQRRVPSLAIQFVAFVGRETLELNHGYPFERDKVEISVESLDPKMLEIVVLLMKKGSRVVEGKVHSFVHVENWAELQQFLTVKYDETKRLWAKKVSVGGAVSLKEGSHVISVSSSGVR